MALEKNIESMNIEELREYAQEQRKRLLEATDFIDDILVIAEKLNMTLDEFFHQYGFIDRPDPRAALDNGSGKRRDVHSEQSYLWFYDYKRIIWLLNVARDYGIRIQEMGIERDKEKDTVSKSKGA